MQKITVSFSDANKHVTVFCFLEAIKRFLGAEIDVKKIVRVRRNIQGVPNYFLML